MPRLVELTSNLPSLYPIIAPVRFKDITITGGKLAIEFSSDDNSIVGFSVRNPDYDLSGNCPRPVGVTTCDKGEPLLIPIDVKKQESLKYMVYSIRKNPSTRESLLKAHGLIEILITPPAHYAAHGNSSPGWITISRSDIPFDYGSRVADWLPEIPKSDKGKIEALFPLIPGNSSEYVDAREILQKLTNDLEEHKGTPSDKMNPASPLEQYEMAMRGESRAQCNNLVEMFVYFCRARGIPARRINLWQGGLWDRKTVNRTGYDLLSAGGHTVAEIYDIQMKKWVLLDPIYGVIYFSVGEYLSLAEFQILMQNREIAIQMGELVPNAKGMEARWHVFPFEEWKHAETYRNYLNPTQKVSYVVPDRPRR